MMPTNFEIVSAIVWVVVITITTVKLIAAGRKAELDSVFGYSDNYYDEH